MLSHWCTDAPDSLRLPARPPPPSAGAGLAYALVGGAPVPAAPGRRAGARAGATPTADPARHRPAPDTGPAGQGGWVRVLAALEPDLVVDTGDNLAHRDAVPAVLEALGPLLDVPGAFVLGSNDYYAPTLKNPLRYFLPQPTPGRSRRTTCRGSDLRAGLVAAGWDDLTNRDVTAKVADRVLAFVGADDAHLQLRPLRRRSRARPTRRRPHLGVTHAPYLRVLDAMAADGIPLVLAGPHPRRAGLSAPLGALVTNCDLPRSRAKGLHRRGDAWLHVSAGLGTSPYAPIRFACRPRRPCSRSYRPTQPDWPNSVVWTIRFGTLSQRFGVWRSLVARFVRDEEVVGSNPATPTHVVVKDRPLARHRSGRPDLSRVGQVPDRWPRPPWSDEC